MLSFGVLWKLVGYGCGKQVNAGRELRRLGTIQKELPRNIWESYRQTTCSEGQRPVGEPLAAQK